jgi:hypothetical protein
MRRRDFLAGSSVTAFGGAFGLEASLNLPSLMGAAWAQEAATKAPPRNPFLSAEKYGTTHFDPAQTDTFPYPAPRGVFRIDLRKVARVPGGPVGYMQLASTSPQYMWGTSTGAVSYLDISNGQFKAVAQIPVPGVKVIPPAVLERALDQRYTSVEQIEKIVKDDLGVTWERIATNVYMFVDRDNVFYGGVGATIVAYGLADA